MGRMTTVTLDDHATAFLEGQVAAGHFASMDEALTAAVRLLETRDKALVELRAEIEAGFDSGDPVDFEPGRLLAEFKAERAANAGKTAARRT